MRSLLLIFGLSLLAAPAAPVQDPTSVKGVEAEDLQSVPPEPARRAAAPDDREVIPSSPTSSW